MQRLYAVAPVLSHHNFINPEPIRTLIRLFKKALDEVSSGPCQAAHGPLSYCGTWVSHQGPSIIPSLCALSTCLCRKALDEISAGLCDGLTYQEIEARYPEEYEARKQDKLRCAHSLKACMRILRDC